jgi:hypothetical protein
LLHKEDEEKMSFITPFGTYCYMRMSKGHKNVGSMFSRMTKAILRDQIHINVFTYVEYIVVDSKKKSTQIDGLAETFGNMHIAQLKHNPEKCVLGVQRGKVLGCLVYVKGIETNPGKINAIVHMKHAQLKKEVQKLTDRIASLNRFLSKLSILHSTQGLRQFSVGARTEKSCQQT